MRTARSHFEFLTEELRRAGKEWKTIQSFIDFGCGYGRVTRWLPEVLSPQKITACDVKPQAVRWCEREFGVRGLIGCEKIQETSFEQYDALFACSVLTHLSKVQIDAFFEVLVRILKPGGIAVFTGKGSHSAGHADQTNEYLKPEQVFAALESVGYYFQSYPYYRNPDLGDTYFTREWLQQRLPEGLELVHYSPKRFWSHDSYSIQRVGESGHGVIV